MIWGAFMFFGRKKSQHDVKALFYVVLLATTVLFGVGLSSCTEKADRVNTRKAAAAAPTPTKPPAKITNHNSINIGEDGALYTRAVEVQLTLEAPYAVQMYIANTADCTADGTWEAFSATKAWTLGVLNDVATVYVKFMDDEGYESECISDSIVHDDLPPTPEIKNIPADPSNLTTVNIDVTDKNNVVSYRYKIGPTETTLCSDSVGYSVDTPETTNITQDISSIPDGNLTLCVVSTDAAGNQQELGSVTSFTWTKDTTPPGMPGEISALKGDRMLKLSWTESTGDVIGYLLVRKQDAAVSWVPTNGTSYSFGDSVETDTTVAFFGASLTKTDSNLPSTTAVFHYGLFAYDATYNYSLVRAYSGTPAVYEVGSIGGVVKNVTLEGTYAYLAMGPRGVEIYTVSGSLPVFVGRYKSYFSNVNKVAVVANYAYLANMETGLEILDISDPANPILVASYDTPGSAYDVVLRGNYAYVADGSAGLLIFDISIPAKPVLRGAYDTPGTATSLSATSQYAFIADGASGLAIVNIDDPTAPTLKGTYTPTSSVITNTLPVSQSYVYATNQNLGLLVINITDPANPTLQTALDTTGQALSVSMTGNYGFVADGTSGIMMYNISDPAAPTELGGYDTDGTALGVAAFSDYGFVADLYGGLQILSIAQPTSITSVGALKTLSYPRAIAIDGNYAWIADIENGITAVNIATPTVPSLVYQVATQKPFYAISGSATDIVVSGTKAYVAANGGGLQVYDISVPAMIVPVGTFTEIPSTHYALTVSGSYAYIATREYGLTIANISNPAAITKTATYNTNGTALRVALKTTYAYIADDTNGLVVVNVSTPATPTLAGSYATKPAKDIAIGGNYAYIAGGTEGLVIVDITTPTAPTLVSQTSLPVAGLSAESIALKDHYAYVGAVGGCGLWVYDIAVPATPVYSDVYCTPGEAIQRIVPGTTYTFIADKYYGMEIVSGLRGF